MGQRLVVEIKNNAETFCTVYFHWSGYCRYAVSLTAQIADAIAHTHNQADVAVVQKAVLHWVDQNGGGVRGTEEDVDAIRALDPEFNVFAHDYDRDHGLISITDVGMRSQLGWAEYLTTINVEANTCDLGVGEECWPKDADDEDWFRYECDQPDFVFHNPPYNPTACPLEHAMEVYKFMKKSTNDFYGKEKYSIDDGDKEKSHPFTVTPEEFVAQHANIILGE